MPSEGSQPCVHRARPWRLCSRPRAARGGNYAQSVKKPDPAVPFQRLARMGPFPCVHATPAHDINFVEEFPRFSTNKMRNYADKITYDRIVDRLEPRNG